MLVSKASKLHDSKRYFGYTNLKPFPTKFILPKYPSSKYYIGVLWKIIGRCKFIMARACHIPDNGPS